MRYDLTLKQLCQDNPGQLLYLLTGQRATASLGAEFANIRRRLPDLVLRLADQSIYHLEIQSTPLRKMPWRMLEYYALLHQRYPNDRIVQQVLYVGQRSPRHMAAQLTLPELQYHYTIVDLRSLDCRALLAGTSLGDALLALLCQLHDATAVVREVLRRIARLENRAREDALVHLINLMGLRPQLERLIKQEIEAMPITLNLQDNPFYREAFSEGQQRGKAEGKAEGEQLGLARGEQLGLARGEQLGWARGRERLLRKQLQLKFGPLPEWAEAKLVAADSDTLELWAERVLSETTLEGVLG